MLIFYLTPFVADVTFITLFLSQIYVCADSYRLFNYLMWLAEDDDITKVPTHIQNFCL